MSEFIAISHPHVYYPTKRDALLFDRIGMLGFVRPGSEQEMAMKRAELEWLAERDLVFRTGPADFGDALPPAATPYAYEAIVQVVIAVALHSVLRNRDEAGLADTDRYEDIVYDSAPQLAAVADVPLAVRSALSSLREQLAGISDLSAFVESAIANATQKSVRLTAHLHRLAGGLDAIPIGPGSPTEKELAMGQSVAPVIDVVLAALPTPDESTPWQDIIDFRADEDTRATSRRLRRWIRSTALEDRSAAEIRDELEGLLDTYREHLRIHRMKIQQSTFRCVVATVAEIAEDLVKFKLSKLTDLLFSASTRRIALLEAELKAPGREVAYLVRTHDRFVDRGA